MYFILQFFIFYRKKNTHNIYITVFSIFGRYINIYTIIIISNNNNSNNINVFQIFIILLYFILSKFDSLSSFLVFVFVCFLVRNMLNIYISVFRIFYEKKKKEKLKLQSNLSTPRVV